MLFIFRKSFLPPHIAWEPRETHDEHLESGWSVSTPVYNNEQRFQSKQFQNRSKGSDYYFLTYQVIMKVMWENEHFSRYKYGNNTTFVFTSESIGD